MIWSSHDGQRQFLRRCIGLCCKEFHIGHLSTVEEIEKLADNGPEAKLIASLVVLSAPGSAAPFTCRNWDPKTTLCKDYANRPKVMCGEHPYNSVCTRCGYTRVPKISPKDNYYQC